MGSEPLSRIEKILSNIIGEGSYELELPLSDAEEILQAILNDTTTDVAARDRMCEILLCILNNEEYTGETLSRAEEILKCISQGEKYEVDEWTYTNFFSRVEQLLTDWANKEDPEYTKTVSGILIHVLDAVEKPADSLIVSMSPKQEAEPWIDSEPDTEPYLSRIIPRGNRSSREFHGGTVAWNQLYDLENPDVMDSNFVTYDSTNHRYTITYPQGSTSSSSVLRVGYAKVIGHKYLAKTKMVPISETINIRGYFPWRSTVQNLTSPIPEYMIFAPDSATYESIAFGKGSSATIAQSYSVDLQITDLTLMFSNAPAIADYVYSLEQATAGAGVAWLKDHGFIDDEYHGYDPGSLKSVNISALKIIDTDLTEHTYPLTSTDLRGLFMLDAQNKLYTEGDIYPPSGEISRRYGVVDLGAQAWEYNSEYGVFYTYVYTKKGGRTNIMCPKYTTVDLEYRYMQDKDISGTPTTGINIKDSAYTDIATFRTAMSGVPLVYELRTPTTETALAYDNPQVIEVGGIEEFIDNRDVKVPVGNSTIYSAEYEIEGYDNITVYHAQNEQVESPTEYSISFALQGDVYGGTFDVVTGELVVDRKCYTVTGSEPTPTEQGAILIGPRNNRLRIRKFDDCETGLITSGHISNIGVNSDVRSAQKNSWKIGDFMYDNQYVFVIIPSDYTTFETGLSYIASIGATYEYPLTSPQTYNLTPQEVQMLLGENTLWTDDNLNLQLTYKGSNPAMMMQSLRVQNNLLKKQGLKPIEEPLKPLDPIKPIIKK